MSARLSYEQYGEIIGDHATILRANAGSAPLESPVPTCPGWSLRDLVTHQGVVFAWATALIGGGELTDADEAARTAERDAHHAVDLLTWFDDQLVLVLNALARARTTDAQPFFFLKDAPDKRLGWVRRQAFEVAVHAVDAMTARLGRPVHPEETRISPRMAADGIDELLLGFLPRRTSTLRTEQPLVITVEAEDTGDAWTVQLSAEPPRCSPGRPAAAPESGGTARPAPATIRGDAVPLFLALWNRGEDVTWDGDGLRRLWRDRTSVSF